MAMLHLTIKLDSYENGITFYGAGPSKVFMNVSPHSLFLFLKPFLEMERVNGKYTETPTHSGWILENKWIASPQGKSFTQILKMLKGPFLDTLSSSPPRPEGKQLAHFATLQELQLLMSLMTEEEKEADGECGPLLHSIMAEYIRNRDPDFIPGDVVAIPEMEKECSYDGNTLYPI